MINTSFPQSIAKYPSIDTSTIFGFMELRSILLELSIFFFFSFSLFSFFVAYISSYKWLQWVIFLKGHYISLAYFQTIHITEGCLQLWAKQWKYCHPHDQADKETTALIVIEKRTLCLHKRLCTFWFLPEACPHFELLVGKQSNPHMIAESTLHGYPVIQPLLLPFAVATLQWSLAK